MDGGGEVGVAGGRSGGDDVGGGEVGVGGGDEVLLAAGAAVTRSAAARLGLPAAGAAVTRSTSVSCAILSYLLIGPERTRRPPRSALETTIVSLPPVSVSTTATFVGLAMAAMERATAAPGDRNSRGRGLRARSPTVVTRAFPFPSGCGEGEGGVVVGVVCAAGGRPAGGGGSDGCHRLCGGSLYSGEWGDGWIQHYVRWPWEAGEEHSRRSEYLGREFFAF